jgi:hypothetical protein
LISTSILSKLEEITHKGDIILHHLWVLRILDTILTNKWYEKISKDTWNLIYLANYLFDFYKIFKGATIAESAVNHAKDILLSLLDRGKQLTPDQSQEITKMLMFDPLRSFEKVTIEFDRDCKVAKAKLESLDLAEKVEGL